MKRYGYYIIIWWDFKNRKTCEKSFKMRKPARRFAAKLADDDNAQDREFFAYDRDLNLTDNFRF